MSLVETGVSPTGNSFCQVRKGTTSWVIRKAANERGTIWRIGHASPYPLGITAPSYAPTVTVSTTAVDPSPAPTGTCAEHRAVFLWTYPPALWPQGVWNLTTPFASGLAIRGCWEWGCTDPPFPDFDGSYEYQTWEVPCMSRDGIEELQSTVVGDGNCWKGKYYCAIRYVDDDGTPSSLSPFCEVTTKYQDKLAWSNLATPDALDLSRVTEIELYRSLVNNNRVLYRVHSGPVLTTTTFDDSYSDAELLTMQALPLLNDDGTLCARRFERPPDEVKVIVPYKDRYFGLADDAIYFSYPGEPESMPAVNRLDPCLPADDSDIIVSGVAAETLWVFRHRHTHNVSYGTNPMYDASFRTIFSRGILNANCFARLGDAIYCLDENGPWRLSSTAEAIDAQVKDWFRDDVIVWASRDKFFVSVDPAARLVRYHVIIGSDSVTYPNRTLTFDANSETWFVERYANELGCGAVAVQDSRARSVYGTTNGHILVAGTGFSDYGGSIDYTYKTAKLTLPIQTPNQPRTISRTLVITYKPTTADHWVTVRLYYDEDTDPVNAECDTDAEGIQTRIGSPDFQINLKLTAFQHGTSLGFHRITFPGRTDRKLWTHQKLTVTVSGTQSSEEVCLYGIEFEPAT